MTDGSDTTCDRILRFRWDIVAHGDAGPGVRSRHCLAYDGAAEATVLFGGIIWDGPGALCNDTWELQSGQWTWVEQREAPVPRHRGAMVYDARRGCCLMFGGQAESGALLDDCWTYADGRWRRRRAGWFSRAPTARCGHALAHNEAEGRTILFGGIGRGNQSLGDTWSLEGNRWRMVRGAGPPPRRYAAFAYDADLQGCVLHGGSVDDHGRQQFADCWLFRDQQWRRLPPAFGADCRDDHGMAYHEAAQRLVMLDGLQGARGLLVRKESGWQKAKLDVLHPRHQCSPLAWDANLQALVLHGGEARHGGPQTDATLALRTIA